jgi:hypothetical protein
VNTSKMVLSFRRKVILAQEVRHSQKPRQAGDQEPPRTIRAVRRSTFESATGRPTSTDLTLSTKIRSWRPSPNACRVRLIRRKTDFRCRTVCAVPGTEACRRGSTRTRPAAAASATDGPFRRSPERPVPENSIVSTRRSSSS